jgi:pimeloyl-ACP methyl ester carboxylesterase
MLPGRLKALVSMATPRRYFDKAYLRKVIGQIYGGDLREKPERGLELLRHVRSQHWRGYYLQMVALSGWTSVHWLHCLQQPTLVMSGDDDPIIHPLNAKLQFVLLRDALFWRIDCGHLFLLTRAPAAAAAIRQFLQHANYRSIS